MRGNRYLFNKQLTTESTWNFQIFTFIFYIPGKMITDINALSRITSLSDSQTSTSSTVIRFTRGTAKSLLLGSLQEYTTFLSENSINAEYNSF